MTHSAVEILSSKAPDFKPSIGIVIGSGLGKILDSLDIHHRLPYTSLPGFPPCGVDGHAGDCILGYLDTIPIACLSGRAHFYEGVDNASMQIPLRTLRALGCDTVLIASAVGSLYETLPVGQLVLIRDHINFQFRNPLTGPNDNEIGPRFLNMDNAYDKDLRASLLHTAKVKNISLIEGVYGGTLGPSFETPAEIKALRLLGADVVGMSTIPEVIIARHCGLKVAVLATVTNLAAGLSEEPLSHELTLKGARLAEAAITELTTSWVRGHYG